MEVTYWYAVSMAAFGGCLILYLLGNVLFSLIIPPIRNFMLRKVVYPIFIKRCRWWPQTTRIQGLTTGSYFIINGFCMGVGIRNQSELMTRSGVMASINLVPLFLGGRTNIFANYLGISIHTYYIAHHWIGRMVIFQSILHLCLAIALKKPWTFNSSQISGISAASAISLLGLLSLYFVRTLVYEFFLKVHFLLAFIAVISLFKHIQSTPSSRTPKSIRLIYVTVALSLWALNTILRLVLLAYRNTGARKFRNQGTIGHYSDHSGTNVSAMKLSVRLRRPLPLLDPGLYCYLSFSDNGLRGRIQSHPYIITWWDDSKSAMNLDFLIQPQAGLSADLISRIQIRNVMVEGPYGKKLHLDRYETVILVAKGIGIAGILPYMRHLTYRRLSKGKENEAYRRGLMTRKVDVLWQLEENSQEEWVSEWFAELQTRDSENLMLNTTCFYPSKRTTGSLIEKDHWKLLHVADPGTIIEGLIRRQVQRSPGRTKITVCGDSTFSGAVRSMGINIMSEYNNVEFAETEFQPQTAQELYPGVHAIDTDVLEMGSRPLVRSMERGRRLLKSRFSLHQRIAGINKKLGPIDGDSDTMNGVVAVRNSSLSIEGDGLELTNPRREKVKEVV